MISVGFALPGGTYEVAIGSGVARRLPEVLRPTVRRVALVTQEEIGFQVDAGVDSETFFVPRGEQAKSLAVVEGLCRGFARAGIARSDAVVAVGGGVVTDVAGFSAAVYLRGISVVHVATTLLAQVDAAIGGKTGVNIAEGKNLVGSFWQPDAVLCDTDALGSLPAREWASGRGEMAKCAFLENLLDDRRGPPSPHDGAWLQDQPLEEQIARCVRIKAAAVTADERESGVRALLNYGHTLAHALEAVELAQDREDGGALRHGEAVAVGLVFAARLARRLGRIDEERVQLHRKILEGMELPTELPLAVSARDLLEYMARDKKSRHDLTFVLDGPSGVDVVRGVSESDVLATLSEMGCAP